MCLSSPPICATFSDIIILLDLIYQVQNTNHAAANMKLPIMKYSTPSPFTGPNTLLTPLISNTTKKFHITLVSSLILFWFVKCVIETHRKGLTIVLTCWAASCHVHALQSHTRTITVKNSDKDHDQMAQMKSIPTDMTHGLNHAHLLPIHEGEINIQETQAFTIVLELLKTFNSQLCFVA
jgi:hypothetical protein